MQLCCGIFVKAHDVLEVIYGTFIVTIPCYLQRFVNRKFWMCFWRWPSPTPLLKAGSITAVCPWHWLFGFLVLKDGDYTTSLCNLLQWLTILTGKRVFLMFKWNYCYLNLYAVLLILSLTHTVTRPHQVFIHLVKILPSLLFFRLTVSAIPLMLDVLIPLTSLQTFARLSPACPCLSRTGPRTQSNISDVTSSVLSRGEGQLCSTCW